MLIFSCTSDAVSRSLFLVMIYEANEITAKRDGNPLSAQNKSTVYDDDGRHEI